MAIASRNQELADTFRVFPTFLREGRATTARATSFAKDANPLIDQLRPAARQISPALIGLDKLSPDLRDLFKGLGPFVGAARQGLPATSQVLNNTRPILRRLDPFLRNLTPIFDYLGAYKGEIAAFFGNDAAATQLRSQPINKAVPGPLTESGNLHVLRTLNPMNPEIMAGFPTRLVTNRSNPYTAPGAYNLIKPGSQLPVFGSYLCGTTPVPDAPPPVDPYWPADLVARVNEFVYGDPDNRGAAPPCVAQGSLGQLLNQRGVANAGGEYPRLQPLP
jgi:ABC-type transporter Mla subunit MlaD